MPSRRLTQLSVEGPRVRLRLHAESDADAAWALLAREERILRWLVWDGPGSRAELAEHYAHAAFDGEYAQDFRLALEELPAGVLIGSLTLRFGGHPGQGDVGYWLGVPFQGRGLGREALQLAAHAAFAHLGAEGLTAWVFVGNEPSRRVLERTGFSLVRTVPGRVLKKGARVDEWHFVLLKSDWRRHFGSFRPVRESVTWSETPYDPLEDAPSPFPRG
jgi:RimJ/RimL family protein N-acetyltransferase